MEQKEAHTREIDGGMPANWKKTGSTVMIEFASWIRHEARSDNKPSSIRFCTWSSSEKQKCASYSLTEKKMVKFLYNSIVQWMDIVIEILTAPKRHWNKCYMGYIQCWFKGFAYKYSLSIVANFKKGSHNETF